MRRRTSEGRVEGRGSGGIEESGARMEAIGFEQERTKLGHDSDLGFPRCLVEIPLWKS